MAFFDLPLDLPHAATVADRIVKMLADLPESSRRTRETASTIAATLMFYRYGENPPAEEAEPVRLECLGLARELVADIERDGLNRDRLGQWVRNLFECLAAGEEGAAISIRAGENPNSIQRP